MHSGILAAAVAVHRDLTDHGVLSSLLSGASKDPDEAGQHPFFSSTPQEKFIAPSLSH